MVFTADYTIFNKVKMQARMLGIFFDRKGLY